MLSSNNFYINFILSLDSDHSIRLFNMHPTAGSGIIFVKETQIDELIDLLQKAKRELKLQPGIFLE